MAFTISPSALPAPKKNSFYSVYLVITAGLVDASIPVTWAVTSGALPGFLTLAKVYEGKSGGSAPNSPVISVACVSGKVPATLDATTFTATITATGTDAQTGTVVSTTIAKGVDGPDAQFYHGTEANRTTIQTYDSVIHGTGLTAVADAIQRLWPLTGPSQNS
jgi:hypothetical protein